MVEVFLMLEAQLPRKSVKGALSAQFARGSCSMTKQPYMKQMQSCSGVAVFVIKE